MTLNLRVLSVAVAVALAMLAAVQLADPASLGISPVAVRWLGIVGVGLGLLQGFLPKVQGATKDPEALADRVWALPEADRRLIANDLAHRAERAKRATRAKAVRPVPDGGDRGVVISTSWLTEREGR